MFKNKNFSAIVFIFFVTCLIFFKIFLKGLYPVPGDLLASFYFPFYSGGWEGYNPWTTHKELLGADSIRQIYLWKEFAANAAKQGSWPLWNPYTFSGQPLLANFQSSVFYPLNVFYFLTDSRNAWIILVVLQPLLGGIFMYLAARSFKLSNIPSVFTAISFMLSSYLITWMENGNISHSYIWLPLSFWAINNFFASAKHRFLLVLNLSLVLSILAGHPQTAIYIYITVAIYWLFKTFEAKKNPIAKTFILAITFLISFFSSAIQLIPTYYFYKISPISLPFSREVFDRAILPAKNLVTFFASDFFGHPANNNFWSQTYGDFTPYFGVIPLILSLWAIVHLWKDKFVKFAAITSLFFILASVHGPITYAIKTFRIPLLDSTTPSRFIAISIFLLIIISGFALGDLLKNFEDKKYFKKFFKFLIPIGIIYVLLWAFAILGTKFLEPEGIWQTNLAVTRRNLILPTMMFLALPIGLQAVNIFSKVKFIKFIPVKNLFIAGIFLTTLVGGIYYTNKFLPFAPKNYIFPRHPLFDWLGANAGINRFYGGGTAHVDFNFPTHYEIYTGEGYDTLRIERYAQLLASGFSGQVPESYLRSDGVFANEENGYRKRLFDLLGVKYLVDKEDDPKSGADWHYERFPNDQVNGIWQGGKFQVYMRPTALPRIFLTTNYKVASDKEIIKNIYDSNFNLETLLLEKDPTLKIDNQSRQIAGPKSVDYKPGNVTVATNVAYNALLFISDTHDPGWKVKIDGNTALLMRAHYALMATEVPAGDHIVNFSYRPKSFKYGVYSSAFGLTLLVILSLYSIRQKRF